MATTTPWFLVKAASPAHRADDFVFPVKALKNACTIRSKNSDSVWLVVKAMDPGEKTKRMSPIGLEKLAMR